MNRFFASVLALAWSLCANAFQDQIMHLKGVTITATHSATRLCGVDFVISVSDNDQHFVAIDFRYNGTFNDNARSSDLPMHLVQGTRGDTINISVGRNTLYGGLARVAAREWPVDTLVCRNWVFSFNARENNMSQAARDHEDKLKQKEQARLDEINRRKAEAAERKRKAEQHRQDYLDAQAKAKRDQLVAYKNASPENARCIINEPADITRCEQAKAREKADLLKRKQDEMWAQKQREAKALDDARQQEQFRQSDLLHDRTRADPCGVAAEQAQRMPQPAAQPNSAAAMQQAQAQAQWKQAQAGLEEMCRRSKNQNQEILELQAEQQRRFLAQQQAQADLNAAIQRGKATLNEAARDTQGMQNDNADLMTLINRMK